MQKVPWTQEEEEKLAELHAEYGNKWAEIARQMPGRYVFSWLFPSFHSLTWFTLQYG